MRNKSNFSGGFTLWQEQFPEVSKHLSSVKGMTSLKFVADSVLAAVEQDGFQLHERDVICVTEAVVARADGNYASTEDIAADVKAKLGGETVGVVFPILSRNRFAICLRGIAKGCKEGSADAELSFR